MKKRLARRLSTLLTAFVLLLGLMLPASAVHTVVRTIGDDLSALENTNSCSMCKRMIINAGIETVVVRNTADEYTVISVEDWIENDESLDGVRGY